MPRPATQQHQLRLTDATWASLEAIAAREGLLYGGLPSRALAVAWLVERDQQAIAQPDTPSRAASKD
jgi:hypothetical protein